MGLFDFLKGSSGQGNSGAGPDAALASDLWAFGRFEILTPRAPQALAERASVIEPRYYGEATANPEAFSRRVLAIAQRHGGWHAYGGARLLRSLLTSPAGPTFDAVVEESFRFLRSRNINFMYLSPVEIDWWVRHHPDENYLQPIKPLPPTDAVTPFALGEFRKVAEMGPQGNNNVVFVHRTADKYLALIQSPGENLADTTRMPWDSNVDLYNLYEELGSRLRVEPPWCDAELARFCRLAAPDLSE